jgi:hypothetical protein
MIYCKINVEKLKKLEFSSYSHKALEIEKRHPHIQTTFRITYSNGSVFEKEGGIREGILFFKDHNIDDKSIHDLLSKYITNRNFK